MTPFRKPHPNQNPRINWNHTINRKLVACWLFNEGKGRRFHDIAGKNHGTFHENNGRFAKHQKFNASVLKTSEVGTSFDASSVPNSPSFPSGRAITFEVWFLRTVPSVEWQDVAAKDCAGTDGWGILLSSSTVKFFCSTIDGPGTHASSTSTITDNRWYHAVMTYDGANIRGYLNGVLESTQPNTHDILNDSTPLTFGNDPAFGQWFGGLISISRLWNRVLSPKEVQSLYKNPNLGISIDDRVAITTIASVTTTTTAARIKKQLYTKPRAGEAKVNWNHPLSKGLRAWWLFNEGKGQKIRDIAGKNHGTLQGSMTRDDWETDKKWQSVLDLDGTNDYVNCGDNARITGDRYSLSVWFKSGSVAQSDEGLLGDYNASGGCMLYHASTVFSFYYKPFGQISVTGIVTDRWYNLVGVVNGTVAILYLDGVERSRATDAPALLESDQPMTIGTYLGASQAVLGKFADARIWNRPLSPHEVKEMYKNPYVNLVQPEITVATISTADEEPPIIFVPRRRRRLIISL